jgi:mRNA interferase RelE/StbE
MKQAVEFSGEAVSDIDHIHRADRRLFERILTKIGSLADDPRQGKSLVGNHRGEFSLRVGNYRIVYLLDAAKSIVYILTIKHRKHVY